MRLCAKPQAAKMVAMEEFLKDHSNEIMIVCLVAMVLFMWVIFAPPTPDERTRLHDSMGASTGIAWR